MDNIQEMNRRDFIRFVSVFAVSFLMPHAADAKEVERLLDNEDREGFNVRFIMPIKPVNPEKWILQIGGLCEHPGQFTLGSIKKLTKDTQVSRMTCVEGWSGKAKWGGFFPQTLFNTVKPKKEAKYLYFYSADNYYEYISLEDLLKPRVIFAYEMDNKPLPDIHGGPLRLLIPSRYGYKSVKTIMKLDFVEKEGTGYWSQFGYPRDGTIKPGTDHALDLKTYKIIKKDGEPDY